MGIDSISQASLAALQANQLALRSVSDNIANLDTQGYARKETHFQNRQQGVAARIQLAADKFLQAAHLHSAAKQSDAETQAKWLDRAQSLLGDPNGQNTLFSALNKSMAALENLPANPASSLHKTELISSVSQLLNQIQNTANSIEQLQQQVRTRLHDSTNEINSLLQNIARLNTAIQQDNHSSHSSARTEQAALIDRLSQLMDIQTQELPLGGTQIHTQSGLMLAGLQNSRLDFKTAQANTPELVIQLPQTTISMATHLRSGELAGLTALDGRILPDISAALGNFASAATQTLNRGHNQAWPIPAPQTLNGQATGLMGSDSLAFSGEARLGIVDTQGRLLKTLTIDFDAKTIRNDNSQTWNTGNNIDEFTSALNTALGTNASASFSGGRMRIHTNTGGIVIEQDTLNPALRAGQGFSEHFGLHNLIEPTYPASSATGLSASDPHGFQNGQKLHFSFRDEHGQITNTRQFTFSGNSMADLLDGLNTDLNGQASAELDANGRLSLITSSHVEISGDTALRGDTGLSFQQIFGTGQKIQAQKAKGLLIRPDIAQSPQRLGSAAPELEGKPAGALVLTAGDSKGALLMQQASQTKFFFPEAGHFAPKQARLDEYAAAMAGQIGQDAASAETRAKAEAALYSDIHDRRQSAQGVSLDEELVKMTNYQQAYAAASRMMQASRELYEILLRIV